MESSNIAFKFMGEFRWKWEKVVLIFGKFHGFFEIECQKKRTKIKKERPITLVGTVVTVSVRERVRK